jgi:SAM-dependent methyltransferase
MATTSIYENGEYLAQNPTWHSEDSPRKAEQIMRMLYRHKITPRTVCEVGCGAGEILRQLQLQLPDDCELFGYDISPQAYKIAVARTNRRLHFRLADLTSETDEYFDLALVIDVIEHLDNYYSFLRQLRPRSEYKIFHIPLELSAYSMLRSFQILQMRDLVGHIHHFNRDIALAALRETGYQVLDWCYPYYPFSLRGMPVKQKILWTLRRTLRHVSLELAVRLLGGQSLLVLAR